jgi:DNA-binding transcriptional LysR family regulator
LRAWLNATRRWRSFTYELDFVNLRHLGYLVALAREEHFRRAAVAVHVTQPTLSAAIRQLETELGVPLVQRSRQRFQSLTSEGRQVVGWAQRILADCDALRQSLGELKGALKGHVRLGVVPTAEPVIARLTKALQARHPQLAVSVFPRTSREIERDVAEHAVEAGISYIAGPLADELRAFPLYLERYVVVGASALLGRRRTIGWLEAATLPLCLLNREMQNRRLLDGHFAQVNAVPSVVAESNTLVGVLSHVRSGSWCGILPVAILPLLGDLRGLSVLPLHSPDAVHRVGLLFARREPLPPLVQAVFAAAQSTGFDDLARR